MRERLNRYRWRTRDAVTRTRQQFSLSPAFFLRLRVAWQYDRSRRPFADESLAAGLGLRMATLKHVGVIGADHLAQALRRMNV